VGALVSLITLGYNLKLYSEFFKERVKGPVNVSQLQSELELTRNRLECAIQNTTNSIKAEDEWRLKAEARDEIIKTQKARIDQLKEVIEKCQQKVCSNCRGVGVVGDERAIGPDHPCPRCKGTGVEPMIEHSCRTCASMRNYDETNDTWDCIDFVTDLKGGIDTDRGGCWKSKMGAMNVEVNFPPRTTMT
jgi:DnaJ-class molecular chaperone